MRKGTHLLMAVLVCVLISTVAFADPYFENLTQDQKVNGFTVKNVYENATGAAMGARFVSDRYGFVLDLMRVQSVPQAFFWVKSDVLDSRGEPHACEHLLLGKGNRGKFVAGLEDMALGNSTAYTSQLYTAYPFNTSAGEQTFYRLFEAKLDAMLNPDFTDEEIRREVCHIGIVENPETGELLLDEKGTVYTEMISSFEKHWYHLWYPMDSMQYGPEHTLTVNTGGHPDIMREMVPAHMWEFHKRAYQLGNMGTIASIADDIEIETFLSQISGILGKVQKEATPDAIGTINTLNLPMPVMAKPFGAVRIASFPSDNPEDPGHIILGYPPHLEYDNTEQFMFELFMETFAGGPTSNLYKIFINSDTRKIDLGGNSVWGSASNSLGHPVYFGLSSINNKYVTEEMIDSVRNMISDAIAEVANYAEGSDELAEFNENAKSRLIQNAKDFDQYMNSPPMFGFRGGPGGGWYNNLKFLENDKGFRKSLVQKKYFDFANKALEDGKNIWTEYIDRWQLLTVKPYAVGAVPNGEMIQKATEEKRQRIAQYVSEFKEQYGAESEQEAIAAYKADFDKMTADLKAAESNELPGFIDNPPMTLDDQLKYEEIAMPGDVTMVASTFDNMTSSTIGIAMRLDVIPEDLLMYVPYLWKIPRHIGVVKDGEVVEYDEMQNRLRREVLSLRTYPSTNMMTGRMELVIRGAGSNLDELNNVIDWMDAALYTPYLDVENLSRMKDLVDQELVSLRSRMKGSEEGWVNNPSNAYRWQTNPLYLATSSFLTQAHLYQRLKWQLTDPGSDADRQTLASFIGWLRDNGKDKNRENFGEMFAGLETAEQVAQVTGLELSETAGETALSIVKALKATLPEIPDESLAGDWAYLCDETEADLMVMPSDAIAKMDSTLGLVRKADNARMFMISSSADRAATLDKVKAFAGKLDDDSESVRQVYADAPVVFERVKSRRPGMDRPTYVGLLNENTRNGVLIFGSENNGQYDTTLSSVLDCLAGQLYSGGGAHSLFMKTWGAGLAYSNGYRYSASQGNGRYYAERCPDVSETMRFVVNELKTAEDDPYLTEYAVAQVFGATMAASRYEQRGETIAANLADGLTPERVKSFRQAILKARSMDNLYEELKSRLPNVYGQTLIGYGPALTEVENGSFFMIGPEPQFESLEKYIEQEESKQEVCRLYPRDFWLTM